MDSGRTRVPKETASKDQWVGVACLYLCPDWLMKRSPLLHFIVCVPCTVLLASGGLPFMLLEAVGDAS